MLASKMNSITELQQRIREEFSDVPFPSHCGLHAAVAKDDWIDDERVLREITQREEFIGEWWNVPIVHLVECMVALSYLDAAGMEFYLPAYMNAVVGKPAVFDLPRVKSRSWQIVHAMLPEEKDRELIRHFNHRFKNIYKGKKRVCKEFLRYIENCDSYNEHAREIANKALTHEFWSCSS